MKVCVLTLLVAGLVAGSAKSDASKVQSKVFRIDSNNYRFVCDEDGLECGMRLVDSSTVEEEGSIVDDAKSDTSKVQSNYRFVCDDDKLECGMRLIEETVKADGEETVKADADDEDYYSILSKLNRECNHPLMSEEDCKNGSLECTEPKHEEISNPSCRSI